MNDSLKGQSSINICMVTIILGIFLSSTRSVRHVLFGCVDIVPLACQLDVCCLPTCQFLKADVGGVYCCQHRMFACLITGYCPKLSIRKFQWIPVE